MYFSANSLVLHLCSLFKKKKRILPQLTHPDVNFVQLGVNACVRVSVEELNIGLAWICCSKSSCQDSDDESGYTNAMSHISWSKQTSRLTFQTSRLTFQTTQLRAPHFSFSFSSPPVVLLILQISDSAHDEKWIVFCGTFLFCDSSSRLWFALHLMRDPQRQRMPLNSIQLFPTVHPVTSSDKLRIIF